MGFKSLLGRGGPLVIPGVYDALGARIAQRAGFEAMFQTGYGTSAALLGMPDYGFIGAEETVSNARRICGAVNAPVLVDADTGYGNALSVWRLVGQLESAGAAGMFLEDQKWPKRCGHMQGKEVIIQEEYIQKLGAAIDAKSNDDFLIVSRTDARATMGIEEAIGRAKENLECGADIIFVEAPSSIDELRAIGKSIDAPLVANMIEGGGTPVLPAKELYKMGFDIVLYPLSVLYASASAMTKILGELKKDGTTKGEMMNFVQFNELVNLEGFINMEKKYASKRRG